jgi:hypothetical protein
LDFGSQGGGKSLENEEARDGGDAVHFWDNDGRRNWVIGRDLPGFGGLSRMEGGQECSGYLTRLLASIYGALNLLFYINIMGEDPEKIQQQADYPKRLREFCPYICVFFYLFAEPETLVASIAANSNSIFPPTPSYCNALINNPSSPYISHFRQ